MYIFWDNSNIHISGYNSVLPKKEPIVNPKLFRTNFKNLLKLVCNNNKVDDVFLAGSVPPDTDAVWNYLRSINIKPHILTKTAHGTEQESVDILLQNKMLECAAICMPSTSELALLTGDGAINEFGSGFLNTLKLVKEKFNWDISVYAWGETCNRHLREYAEINGKFVDLENYYFNITFIQRDKFYSDNFTRPSTPL